MKERAMTLLDLLNQLDAALADTRLVFATAEGPILPGYHVTELRRLDATGIDCGGVVTSWREVVVQLLDGTGRDYMTVGKFRGILSKSFDRVDGLASAPMRVEFAHENQGLGMFIVADTDMREGVVTVTLAPDHAVCKPKLRALDTITASCCGAGQDRVACC